MVPEMFVTHTVVKMQHFYAPLSSENVEEVVVIHLASFAECDLSNLFKGFFHVRVVGVQGRVCTRDKEGRRRGEREDANQSKREDEMSHLGALGRQRNTSYSSLAQKYFLQLSCANFRVRVTVAVKRFSTSSSSLPLLVFFLFLSSKNRT